MAETNRPEAKTAPAQPAPVSRGNFAPASESTDPEVHQLLAQRQAHAMNVGLDEDPEQEAARKAAKDEIGRIDDRLTELGVTAK